MSRVIYCTFFKKKALGLDFPCFPGKLGQRIYDNISKEAWLEWQKKQTMIINEYKLNMLNISDRKKLEKAMVSFLFKEKNS